MTLFIVLGVAADDIFVFFDAWKQSATKKPLENDLVKRMSFTFHRASRSMLVTSSTTAMAFLANAFST